MDFSSWIFASLFWPPPLVFLTVNAPLAGIPAAFLTGCLFFGVFRRTKKIFLSYFATACSLGLAGGISALLFYFAADIPQLGFFNFGFALCAILALAKFGTALVMGYSDKKALISVFFCCLLSLGMWALLVAGTQIIDAYVDQGIFYLEEAHEVLIMFLGLLSLVFIDGLVLDRMLEERHADNAVLALSMNTVTHGLLILSLMSFAYIAWR